jgi:hypothetical protein
MAQRYELGTPYHCIPVSAHIGSDDDPYMTYLAIPKERVNQVELQRLYRDHPWVWSHPLCCTPDDLLVAAHWDYDVDDSDAEESEYNFLGQHCEYFVVETGDREFHWLRDHKFSQVTPPDDEFYYKGLEFIRITVDKKNERLRLDNLLPLTKQRVLAGLRRKRRGIRIPGIKLM